MSKQRETKDFRLTIKSVGDEGTFTGVLSVYNVVDLGSDLIEKGAFTKTLQESGAEIPCLWQHSEPIGSLKVFDGADGLEVQGTLVLEVQQAREALALMKARVVKGLSIGYRTIKSKVENGVRRISEIALMEGSVVTFPMMPLAQVTDVKSVEEKADFLTELDRAQVLAMRSMMIGSLWNALDSIIWEGDALSADRITASDESIGQFQQAYISFLPKFFALWGEKSQPTEEQKAGRTISSATEAKIREAIKILTALLDTEAAGTKPDEGKAADAQTAEVAKQDGMQPEPQDAEIHSLLTTFTTNIRRIL
jgi:hypothetical protein